MWDQDGERVRQALRRDAKGRLAFSELVRRHQAWLIRYLLYLLGDLDEAHDVAQEVLTRAYVALEQLRDEDRFRPWLRKIATRLAFNHQRDRGTRKRYEHTYESTVAEVTYGPAARVEAREALQAGLAALPYAYREVLIMYYVEELSLKDIAEHLDIGKSAAKMRLSRARGAFKEKWSEMNR